MGLRSLRIRLRYGWVLEALEHPAVKVALSAGLVIGVVGLSIFTYYYVHFSRLIDRRLSGHIFANTSRVYAAPEPLFTGQDASLEEIAAGLRRAGYSENKSNRMGWYELLSGGIEIFPGPESYFQDEPALVRINSGKVQRIVSLKDNTDRQRYELEPQLITNLFDRSREKRRLVRFEDLPPHLVNAVLAIEDKNFFQHSGIDYGRIFKAAYLDLRTGEKVQGASTLTMQLSREFFLSRERTFKRKLAELMITLQLERRLTKQQIFEFYVNQINWGQRGSFSINGVGEASLAYFGKDVKQLSLPEAALLAGLIRGPSFYSPYRHPDRALERRNRVLDAMLRTEAITAEERDQAERAPLRVVPSYAETGDAPYFVDLLKDQLLEQYSEKDLIQGYRIYSTLDMGLQRAASEALRVGMQEVDQELAKRRRKGKPAGPPAQVALVALDPHSGEVKALVGGRDYGASQLNRAVAKRQPGSSFKPFVYAAAFSLALDGSGPVITPTTTVVDEPTTFSFGGRPYEPENYKQKFVGPTTLRNALAHSLNVATVKVAEMTGYEKVAQLAREAGLRGTRGTPAAALGAYEATPLEVAGGYTVFANGGERLEPTFFRLVRSQDGAAAQEFHPAPQRVLDPRVAYLMTNLMQGVMQYGTGAGVRSRGFTAPAAGKTGTSRDGWFAGYTSNLLCVVWVGFDDNSDLHLSGAQSALPVWTAFMKRAITLRRYRNTVPFSAPPGVVSVEIDADTGLLATPDCANRRMEVFVEGTQPTQPCTPLSLQRAADPGLFSGPYPRQPVEETTASGTSAAPGASGQPAGDSAGQNQKKKRSFFGRIFGISRDKDSDKDKEQKEKQPPESQKDRPE